MLSFYEATHLRMHGEDILEDALLFTTAHLESYATRHVSSSLAEQITQALERPLRKSPQRLCARSYISIFQDDPKALHHEGVALLKLAKLDFNLVQSLHKKELSEISRWWKVLDFERELPFARNRIVELYFWTVGVFFEPQYASARKFLTKVIALGSVLDDIYDAYGTFEELKIFTEAIQRYKTSIKKKLLICCIYCLRLLEELIYMVYEIFRWDVDCIDELPDYMKTFYRRLLNVCNEIEEEMVKQGTSYRVHYAKEAVCIYCLLIYSKGCCHCLMKFLDYHCKLFFR
jgi:(-)-germacrene D synthase